MSNEATYFLLDDVPWPHLDGGAPAAPGAPAPPQRLVEAAQQSGARRKYLARGEGGFHSQYSEFPAGFTVPLHRHDHSEIFVILEGSGTLQLYPSPRSDTDELEEFPIRAGSTIARPAGTRRAHGIKAGDDGLTVLAYGTRDPNDIVHYPRSGKISFRGVGVIGRLEQAGYWDGED